MILEIMFEAQTHFFDFPTTTTLQDMCPQICNTIPWVTSDELQTLFSEHFPSIHTRLDQTTLQENHCFCEGRYERRNHTKSDIFLGAVF